MTARTKSVKAWGLQRRDGSIIPFCFRSRQQARNDLRNYINPVKIIRVEIRELRERGHQ